MFDIYGAAKEPKTAFNDHFLVEDIEFLALGHPRCGSGFMAELLSHLLGQRGGVGHESFGPRGISCWMFAVPDQKVPFGSWQGHPRSVSFYRYKYVIHHVRSPLKSVPSIVVENRSKVSYRFRRYWIHKILGYDIDLLDRELDRAVASYLLWNKICALQRPHFLHRIEDDEDGLRDFLVRVGCDLNSTPFEEKEVNSGESKYSSRQADSEKLEAVEYRNYVKPVISDSDWLSLHPMLKRSLLVFCKTYGYDHSFFG